MKTTLLKRQALNFCLFLLLQSVSPVLAQTLTAWNPAGLSSYGPSPWAATSTNSNLTAGGLTRGAGLTLMNTAAPSAWGGTSWMSAANQDVTFTISANTGASVSYSLLNLSYRRSAAGPSVATLEYAIGAASSNYTVISSGLTFPTVATTPALVAPVNLSTVTALQNVSAGTVVKFRIFPTGALATSGTWYVFGPSGISIEGTVSNYNVSIAQTSFILCNGQQGAALTASVNGDTPPYTYSWLPAGGTASVATGLAAGVYSCFVTSATSATTMSTFIVTGPSPLVSGILSQTNPSCNGSANGVVTVSVSGGSPGYTYNWLPAGGTASLAGNLAAGNYTLTITDANNCTGSQPVSITQPAAPSVSANVASASVCKGAVITLGGAGAITYTWTNGIADGVAFTPSATATYTVYGTTANGCNGSGTVAVTVNLNPTVTAVSSKTMICAGETVSLTGYGASTYTWSNGPVTSSVSAVSPSVNTTYTITGKDINGCVNTSTITQKVSACLGISAVSAAGAEFILVIPNPNNGDFTLKTTEDIQLMLTNELGQLLQTLQLNDLNNHELKISNLDSGIYFLIGSADRLIVRQKVIVEK